MVIQRGSSQGGALGQNPAYRPSARLSPPRRKTLWRIGLESCLDARVQVANARAMRNPPTSPAGAGEIVLVACMRDEALFVVEWVAHHLASGFDRIIVYTNDCADGTDRLLDAMASVVPVERYDNPGPMTRAPSRSRRWRWPTGCRRSARRRGSCTSTRRNTSMSRRAAAGWRTCWRCFRMRMPSPSCGGISALPG